MGATETFQSIYCENCVVFVLWCYLLYIKLSLSALGNWKTTVSQVFHWVDIFVPSAEPNIVNFPWSAKSVVSSKKR